MSLISDNTIERVLREASIETFLRGEGVDRFDRKGRYTQCPCPLHGEKKASFTIYPATNRYKCYGCQESGNVVDLYMKLKGASYPDALKALAQQFNIPVEYQEDTPAMQSARQKRESLLLMNEAACAWMEKNLWSDEGGAALTYGRGRWDDDVMRWWRIGYAPANSRALYYHLKGEGYSDDVMEESKLFMRMNKELCCSFIDRMMFPICDGGGRVVGFTGRDMSGRHADDDSHIPKYKNSAEGATYDKKSTLYGLHSALKEAHNKGTMILCEGNPDVIRMQSIGVTNCVAPCGTALTEEQLGVIRSHGINKLWLMYDADEAGMEAMDKNGRMAVKAGFSVSVLAIPMEYAEDGKIAKQDPDSYFADGSHRFEDLRSGLVSWYEFHCEKATSFSYVDKKGHRHDCEVSKDDPLAVGELVQDVSDMLQYAPVAVRAGYIDKLYKIVGKKSMWMQAEKVSMRARGQEETKQVDESGQTEEQREMAMTYGLYIGDHGREKNNYLVMQGQSTFVPISNFIMEPLFHIEGKNAKRMYRITNYKGVEREIELLQKDFVGLESFKCAVESQGNYVFYGDSKQLSKLKLYLYEQTRSVKEIVQLGWQKEGFFAWSNGITTMDGQFVPIDNYGIVAYRGENYYLPALSKFYIHDSNLFVFEKRFVHNTQDVSDLSELATRMRDVYGDNAIVGIAFYLCSIFRDVVAKDKNMPLLNIFGQKGSGKSAMAHTLSSLFGQRQDGVDLVNTTVAGIAGVISRTSNAVCHLDEYKAGLPKTIIETLKGSWDGTGRTRMNMDKDAKAESTNVNCGIILTGQEMTVADDALFSRVIFIMFNAVSFTAERTKAFNDLVEWQRGGLTNITNMVMRWRDDVEKCFKANYDLALNDLATIGGLNMDYIEGRIKQNWTVLLAMYRTLITHLDGILPWSYKESVVLFAKLMDTQNGMVRGVSDIAMFWDMVNTMYMNKTIEEDFDFKIMKHHRFSHDVPIAGETVHFDYEANLLYLNKDTVLQLYDEQRKKLQSDRDTGSQTIRTYLLNDKDCYRGDITAAFNLRNKRAEVYVNEQKSRRKAWVFDYDVLKAKYDLNLDSEVEMSFAPEPKK